MSKWRDVLLVAGLTAVTLQSFAGEGDATPAAAHGPAPASAAAPAADAAAEPDAEPGPVVPASNPNSGCTDSGSGPIRRRPGEGSPDRLNDEVDCDPTRLPTPVASPFSGPVPVDRWRIIDALGFADNVLDPYNTNNVYKGDRPLFGGDYYSVFTATGNSLLETRRVPVTKNTTTGLLDGKQQFFNSQTATFDAVLYQGDTIFKPPDYLIRATPTFNYSSTSSGGTTTSTNSIGAQALYFEKRLRDVSANYDFDSVRVGIQPVTSDFRGFVLADQPMGIRLFGTRNNDIYQYSLGVFRRLPKNPARQNKLGAGIPDNYLLMGNLYIQDLFRPGLTSEVVMIYDRSHAPGTQITLNPGGAPTFTTGARHNYDVVYLGYSADGHLGRWNLTGSLYEVLGRESQGVFTGRTSRVQASFGAAEVSRDFDWIRVRLSGLYASGDSNPSDNSSHGFDGINQTAIFAGTDSAFFIHQRLALVLNAVDLKQRDSLFPSLRSTADTGESNYANPGMELGGLGADMDLAPSLRVSFDVSEIFLGQTETLRAILGRNDVPRRIGTDASVDAIYRPFISQNVITRLSVGKLFAAPDAQGLVGGNAPMSAFLNLILTY